MSRKIRPTPTCPNAPRKIAALVVAIATAGALACGCSEAPRSGRAVGALGGSPRVEILQSEAAAIRRAYEAATPADLQRLDFSAWPARLQAAIVAQQTQFFPDDAGSPEDSGSPEEVVGALVGDEPPSYYALAVPGVGDSGTAYIIENDHTRSVPGDEAAVTIDRNITFFDDFGEQPAFAVNDDGSPLMWFRATGTYTSEPF